MHALCKYYLARQQLVFLIINIRTHKSVDPFRSFTHFHVALNILTKRRPQIIRTGFKGHVLEYYIDMWVHYIM